MSHPSCVFPPLDVDNNSSQSRDYDEFITIVDKSIWLDLPMWYMPDRQLYDKMIRMFLKKDFRKRAEAVRPSRVHLGGRGVFLVFFGGLQYSRNSKGDR